MAVVACFSSDSPFSDSFSDFSRKYFGFFPFAVFTKSEIRGLCGFRGSSIVDNDDLFAFC